MIVDDNSNYEFVVPHSSFMFNNCFIIQSEFPGRGEILAYYYFYRFHLFEKAIVLHDSTFLQGTIDSETDSDIAFLWTFPHHFNDAEKETELIDSLSNSENILTVHRSSNRWTGCFGVQSVISYSFLQKIVTTYDFFRLMDKIRSRNERYHLERIFASLCFSLCPTIPILYGDIFIYYKGWGYQWEQYQQDKLTRENSHLPIVKVWTGR
jgi:hypothetical protein